jgi:hypothetical protein
LKKTAINFPLLVLPTYLGKNGGLLWVSSGLLHGLGQRCAMKSGDPMGLMDRTFFIRFQFAGNANGYGAYQIKQVCYTSSAAFLTASGHKSELAG